MYWVFNAEAECIHARFMYWLVHYFIIFLLYYLYIINYYLNHFNTFSFITMCEYRNNILRANYISTLTSYYSDMYTILLNQCNCLPN